MLLTALVVIVILGFLLEEVLGFLNQRAARQPLDPEIAQLYDEAERQRSIDYGAARYRVGLLASSVSTAALVAALAFGWLADLDAWVRGLVTNEIAVSLLFIAGVVAIRWLLSLPF